MKEITFIGPEMALEHAAFQVFKHVNFQIGIMLPKYDMLVQASREVGKNVNAIGKTSISKQTNDVIELHNGSKIIFCTQTQKAIKGYMFDMFFAILEPLSHEMKLELIPLMCGNPDNILYTVYDR
jgi:hypothetical protein